MWLVKKWREHVALKSLSTESGHWDADDNLYRRDVKHYGRTFVSERETMEEREAALCSMSHAAVAGGPDALAASHAFLPHMLTIFKKSNSELEVAVPLKMQVLRSLSEICYRNRLAQDLLIQDPAVLQAICDSIDDVTHIKECRWCCYLVNVIMADNIPAIDALNNVVGLREALGHASDFPRSWEAWGSNIAMRCLKLLTIRLKTTKD